jgi:hypothetical protein
MEAKAAGRTEAYDGSIFAIKDASIQRFGQNGRTALGIGSWETALSRPQWCPYDIEKLFLSACFGA